MRKPPRSLKKAKEKQMGRPIKKSKIGNPTASGNQITATAIIPGNAQVFTDAYIVSQKGTGKYIMASPSTTASDLVSLVNGAVSAPGQANVLVTPWGAHGSGATVTANVGIYTVALNASGAGAIGNNYKVGETLVVAGGTGTAATVIVANTKVGNVRVNNPGTTGGFVVNSYLIFNSVDWSTPANIRVATVTAGNIATVSIVNPGVFTNYNLPGVNGLAGNMAPDVIINGGSYATLDLQFAVNAFSVGAVIGDKPTIPANPMATATSQYGGTGAKVNATWQVNTLRITAAGSAYDAVNVVFASGAAAATATLTNGNLTATTVTAGGNYTSVPTATVQPITSPVYAEVIYNNTVKDFNGNEYAYNLDQTTLTGPGQATIQSS